LQHATADEITLREQQAENPPQVAILRISSPLNVVHNNRSMQPKRHVLILAPFNLESTTEVPEPLQFKAIVRVSHGTHTHTHEVHFSGGQHEPFSVA
jgi:hypothetical protein